MRVTAIPTQIEQKRQDNSANRAGKSRRRVRKAQVQGMIRPVPRASAPPDVKRGKRSLIGYHDQPMLTSGDRPLGEYRFKVAGYKTD